MSVVVRPAGRTTRFDDDLRVLAEALARPTAIQVMSNIRASRYYPSTRKQDPGATTRLNSNPPRNVMIYSASHDLRHSEQPFNTEVHFDSSAQRRTKTYPVRSSCMKVSWRVARP